MTVGFALGENVPGGYQQPAGYGSTALLAVQRLGEQIRTGKLNNILGIPSAFQTETLALQLGIPLTTLEALPLIDLTIDGADEVDPPPCSF